MRAVRRAHTLTYVALGVAALLPCACRTRPTGREIGPIRGRIAPRYELAGGSYACVITAPSQLLRGPGAEAHPGDLLLENAMARFVVAAAPRPGLRAYEGNLIDAAVQGGEDRMRLLTPLLGGEAARAPRYTDVRIQNEGGPGAAAVVAAEGHLPGSPAVRVRTTYSLAPDEKALAISTTVENGTDSVLSLLELADMVYHGRTVRCAPQLGLWPEGREAAATWLAFFRHGLVWGLMSRPTGAMKIAHEAGVSIVRYAVVDIPPARARTYSRTFLAEVGGPERVWLATQSAPENAMSSLRLTLSDQKTGEPVPDVEIVLTPTYSNSTLTAITGPAGLAQIELPAGRYTVMVRAAGRVSRGPIPISCGAGMAHGLPIELSAAAGALVNVRARAGQFASPTNARISVRSAGRMTPPTPAPPAFPTRPNGGMALADGKSEVRIPLAPAGRDTGGRYALTVSKGPLFECAGGRVLVSAGQEVRMEPVLQQVVEPGEYVAVDFRQHTDASPDCALTPAERVLANGCEGLDAAIVSDPVFRTLFVELPPDPECALVPGLRVERRGTGSFSAFPLRPPDSVEQDLSAALRPEITGAEICRALRKALPEAIVQVDAPLDNEKGYFALSGFDPAAGRPDPPGFAAEFDAIELLASDDVAGARTLLGHWFHLLNTGARVMVTGGSGSRSIAGQVAGIARTFVHCRGASGRPGPGEIAEAILRLREAPNSFVTNGPFIEATLNGQPIGSTQSIDDGKALLRLRVTAPLWVDIDSITVYQNGAVAEHFRPSETTRPLRCDRTFELHAARDSWFVVQATGDRRMLMAYPGANSPTPFAITNPFWVDADGDGRVVIEP